MDINASASPPEQPPPPVVELLTPARARAPAIVLTTHVDEEDKSPSATPGEQPGLADEQKTAGAAGLKLLVPPPLGPVKPQELFDFDDQYRQALYDHIPCHCNRWTLLLLFTIFFCFFGQMVLNWPPWRSLLVKDGAYSWLCGPDDPIDADEGTCASQRNSIASLASIASSSIYIGSAIAGVLLDFVGPRWMVFIGCSFAIAGCVMLAVSNESTQAYFPAFVFMGLSSEQIMTGFFDFTFLFPGQSGLILSIFSVGRSAAFAIPILLDAIWSPSLGMDKLMYGMAIIFAFWIAVVFFLIPRHPYLSPEQFELLLAIDEANEPSEVIHPDYQPSRKGSFFDRLFSDVPSPRKQQSEKLNQLDPLVQSAPPDIQVTPVALKPPPSTTVQIASDLPRKPQNVWLEFGRTLISIKYFPWVTTFMLNVFRCTFYGSAAVDQLGPASDLYVTLSPLSFIPCVPFGIMSDVCGIFVVATIINSSALLAFLVLTIKLSAVTQYLSVIFYFVLQSYSSSQNYVFNAQLFPQRIMSKLVGFSMLSAGLFGLVAPMLYDYATRKGFQKANAIVTGLSGYTMVILLVLYMAHHDKLRMRKELAKLQSKASVQYEMSRLAPSGSFAARRSISRDAGAVVVTPTAAGALMPSTTARLSVDPGLYRKLSRTGRSSAFAEAWAPSRGPAGLFTSRGTDSLERSLTQMREGDATMSRSQLSVMPSRGEAPSEI